ncbi:MAG: DUF1016 family protein [Deltaproteobacteria bacterium]|nr:DUF1016 family protein [Deltaproteobacteria bacterium]
MGGRVEVMRETGHAITERQEAEGWGARVIDQLADEIQRAFPGVGGFSRPNIYRMRAFYLAYPAAESASAIVSQAVRQFAEPLPPEVPDLPWGHIVTLQRLKDPSLRQWYARAAAEGGWSRAVLLAQIDTRLHEREGAAITNFARTLPPPRSDLAQQSLKDPYVFDFLTLGRDAQERDVEAGLVAHVEQLEAELVTTDLSEKGLEAIIIADRRSSRPTRRSRTRRPTAMRATPRGDVHRPLNHSLPLRRKGWRRETGVGVYTCRAGGLHV